MSQPEPPAATVETIVKIRQKGARWKLTLSCGHHVLVDPTLSPHIGQMLRCPTFECHPITVIHHD